MIRFLIRAAIFVGSAALAVWVTSLIVDGFEVTFEGLVFVAIIFAVLQALLAPLILKAARKYADGFIGLVGVVSTFVALLLTDLFLEGLSISGIVAWVFATLLVWAITALAAWLLPKFLLKDQAQKRT
ncbi:phage holin family protein [Demequina aurantiaca]|uniref:phage holin family protein n=1 Tax=Demequina aurantiaca TaxID=676200 RepID=UPI0007844D36|nr:phage holin family protein [Demequina aurantiaca]